jgi:hypothetical protein
MQKKITVVLDKDAEFVFNIPEGVPMGCDAARAWLDVQYLKMACAPLRANGKVLTADKVLVVTQAAGAKLLNDPDWSKAYVAAVACALSKPMVRVDVPSMAITY